jgi:hypothetical protein
MRKDSGEKRSSTARRRGSPSLWRSFCLAMSTFTVIPFPQYAFNPVHLSWSFAFFPFAGLVGAALAGVSLYVLRLLGMSIFFRAVTVLVVLILSSGAIHLDGFADTCDALFSRRDRRAQLEIMRDPHIGVYAVVAARERPLPHRVSCSARDRDRSPIREVPSRRLFPPAGVTRT